MRIEMNPATVGQLADSITLRAGLQRDHQTRRLAQAPFTSEASTARCSRGQQRRTAVGRTEVRDADLHLHLSDRWFRPVGGGCQVSMSEVSTLGGGIRHFVWRMQFKLYHTIVPLQPRGDLRNKGHVYESLLQAP